MDLKSAIETSISGMNSQGTRMRIIAENIANAQSTARGPSGDPYQRRVVSFANELNRASGAKLVTIKGIEVDKSEFETVYDPNHPTADANGYVKMPNVNTLIETMDMKQAQRSYEANLAAVKASQNLMVRTIDLLNNR
ncbi:MAG: flagellar basal body rod protein FlgC [Alphaproteobacteria bacterium]|nr:flagellar basal body rod protein FlgC [Alphaproteobacteria bacterium]